VDQLAADFDNWQSSIAVPPQEEHGRSRAERDANRAKYNSAELWKRKSIGFWNTIRVWLIRELLGAGGGPRRL
jgi:hypothetical protein